MEVAHEEGDADAGAEGGGGGAIEVEVPEDFRVYPCWESTWRVVNKCREDGVKYVRSGDYLTLQDNGSLPATYGAFCDLMTSEEGGTPELFVLCRLTKSNGKACGTRTKVSQIENGNAVVRFNNYVAHLKSSEHGASINLTMPHLLAVQATLAAKDGGGGAGAGGSKRA